MSDSKDHQTTAKLYDTLYSMAYPLNEKEKEPKWNDVGLTPNHFSGPEFKVYVKGQTFDLAVSANENEIIVKLRDGYQYVSSNDLGYTPLKRFTTVTDLKDEIFRLVALKKQINDYIGPEWCAIMSIHRPLDKTSPAYYFFMSQEKVTSKLCGHCYNNGVDCKRIVLHVDSSKEKVRTWFRNVFKPNNTELCSHTKSTFTNI